MKSRCGRTGNRLAGEGVGPCFAGDRGFGYSAPAFGVFRERKAKQTKSPPAARVWRPRAGRNHCDPPNAGAIRRVYERYGFEPVETSAIEYTDALGKFLPDQDRPNEGVFSFQDDDEQWMSLRYDLTAPLARYVAENFDALPKPYRSYRFG